MKTPFLLSVALSTTLLSGCVATAPKLNLNDPQAVASSITVERDNFKKSINYRGPNVATDMADVLFIRAWKDEKLDLITYQIYISDYYSGEWRFYSSAYDSNGNRLDTTLISRDVVGCSRYGCSHIEHVGLNISKEYLEKNKDTGINFKLSGKAGEEVFFIPSSYIKAFLSVVDGKPLPQTAASTSDTSAGTPKEKFDRVVAKIRAACESDELKEFYKKSPCNSNESTLKHLTDETKVTEDQKPIILRQREIISAFSKEGDEILKNMGPDGQRMVKVRTDSYSDIENNSLNLYLGKITWGEYNQRRKEITKIAEDKYKSGK